MRRFGHLIGAAVYILLLSAEPEASLADEGRFTATILVCSALITPDKCSEETAIDITIGPSAANETMCGKFGQAVLAGTALVPRPGLEYVKIICRRAPV